jgi:hypothetical protein
MPDRRYFERELLVAYIMPKHRTKAPTGKMNIIKASIVIGSAPDG